MAGVIVLVVVLGITRDDDDESRSAAPGATPTWHIERSPADLRAWQMARPTPTPESTVNWPCASAKAETYLKAYEAQLFVVGLASLFLEELFGDLAEEPYLIRDDEWSSEALSHLDGYHVAADALLELDAPAELQQMDFHVNFAANALKDAAAGFTASIEELDGTMMDRSTALLSEWRKSIEEAELAKTKACDP